MSRPAVRRPARASLVCLALGIMASFPLAAGEPGPRPRWSFHAGAPLSGPPAFGPEGTIAVGTVDGYVHALRDDGVFRYSYTVNGRVAFSPVVLDDGYVVVASDKSRLYALRPNGSLAWDAMIYGGVTSPLALDAQDRAWLRTGSGTVIAMSRRGGVVGFAKPSPALTFGPLASSVGVVVASATGDLGLIGDYGKYQRISSGFSLEALFAAPSGFLTFGGRTLRAFASAGSVAWTRSNVERVLCASPLVTLEANEIRWISGDGSVEARAPAAGALHEPSTCNASSLFAVDERGAIVQVRKRGSVTRVGAAGGALASLDASRPESVVAAYRDGRLVALKVVP